MLGSRWNRAGFAAIGSNGSAFELSKLMKSFSIVSHKLISLQIIVWIPNFGRVMPEIANGTDKLGGPCECGIHENCH